MSVNISNIEALVSQKLSNALNSEDVLLISKFIKEAKNGSVSVVPTVLDLPNITTATLGELVLVSSEDLVYVADVTYWRALKQNTILSLWTWGYNGSGQLGDNSTVNKSSPVSVVGGFTDWCQVSAGGHHSTAVRTNGTMWTWGYNLRGNLGDNSTVNKSSPVSVVGGFTDWCQVTTGTWHTAAIRTNGTLWTWGYNGYGQLGDNSTVNKSSPVSVVGGFTDWCQVSAGLDHTAAVRTNGTAWAWGNNDSGQLGDNAGDNQSSPVSVAGGFTDWCQISAGGNRHTVAVRSNGTIWSWGYNGSGRLGDGTTIDKSSPVSVVGGFTDWCQVSACLGHTAAVRANGTLWTWGCNGYGQLGDNSTVSKSSPVSIVGGFTDWCQIDAGSRNTTAVRSNGTAWTWGYNGSGQLGDNTIVNKSSPVSVVGGFTDWCQVSAGGSTSIGIRVRIL